MTSLISFSSCVFWELVLIGVGILLLVGGMDRFGWSDFIHSFGWPPLSKQQPFSGGVNIKEST